MRIPLGMIALIGAMAVAGCGNKGLRDIRKTGTGPDEFLILPSKPLSEPASYAELPTPTPGGVNKADANPMSDAVVALGGKSSALVAGQGVPASDGALVTASSRYGVEANVRQVAASEDAAYRKKKRLTGRIKLFPVDRYEQIYAKQTLEPHPTNQEFRRAGVGTPTAPPPGED